MFKNVISVTYEMASDTGIGHGHRHSASGQGLALGIGRALAGKLTKCLSIGKQDGKLAWAMGIGGASAWQFPKCLGICNTTEFGTAIFIS